MGRRLIIALFLFLFIAPLSAQKVLVRDTIPSEIWFGLPVALYSEKTSWAFGATGGYYFRTDTIRQKYSVLQVSGIYTLKKQIQFAFAPKYFSPSGKQIWDGLLTYEKFPLRYYEIGNSTHKDSSEIYHPTTIKFDVNAQWKIADNVFVGGGLSYYNEKMNETENAGFLERNMPLGWDGFHLLGMSLIASRDKRDNQFYPKTGSFQKVKTRFFKALNSTSTDFVITELDLRNYFSMNRKSILATQLVSKWAIGDVPFQLLPKIGGIDVLRGYNYGRYRDQLSFVVQAEYRRHLYKRIYGTLFVAAGDVFNSIDSYKFKEMKMAFGSGLRYKLSETGMNLRFDLGVNRDMKTALYVTVLEAF